MIIREMYIKDVAEIMKIQSECYGVDQIESPLIFISILQISNASCFVIEYDNIICGYIFAHKWYNLDKPPELHKELDKCEFKCIFIHDLAIRPYYQKRGFGQLLFSYLENMYNMPFTLVAVNGAEQFWNKNGFKQVQCDESILDSYKCKAVYMRRDC
jgi:GNAT superfamily N-acetyltransferase